ncbi:ceramide phosphoethanolamine synthase-like [Watersipora subatra]|uniref:ceramide phosphoethanolamine synthase-like n=1 Tax=Watersipora subatra TaxID=2589382 RepID=UPI00355B83DD
MLSAKVMKLFNKATTIFKERSKEVNNAVGNHKYSVQNVIVYGVTALVAIYFVIMDLLTYIHIQRREVRTADPPPYRDGFHYFRMLSIKGAMEDHLSCHINWPLAELFEASTNFSQQRGISPNVVSVFGALIAIPAAKLLSTDNMLAKRVGIVIFMIRLWIDSVDGVVYRMQHLAGAEKHVQQSIRHSSGWLVDFFCDLFAALMFLFGAYQTMKQNLSKNSGQAPITLHFHCYKHRSPVSSPRLSSSGQETPDGEGMVRVMSLKIVWIVLLVFSSSALWDYFTQQYRNVFEVTLPTPYQQEKQNMLLRSNATFLIFWLWRLMNGVSLINAAFLAAAYDKLWEYMHYLQLFGTPALLLLTMLSSLHLSSVRREVNF